MAQLPDPLTNPYAPPAAPASPRHGDTEPHAPKPSRYEGERRSVLLLLVLSIITLGVYPSLWYVLRTRFLDSLDANKKVGPWPWVNVVLTAMVFVASVARAHEDLVRILQLGGGITSLSLAFRVAGILRSDFARTGRFIGVSSLGVFFFGCVYLQHVINEAADTPARVTRTAPETPLAQESSSS
jgi:hypothetical protein